MPHFNDTTHEEHMRELTGYDKWLCKRCDYNYSVFNEHGTIAYCSVLEIYEPAMRKLEKCDHSTVDRKVYKV